MDESLVKELKAKAAAVSRRKQNSIDTSVLTMTPSLTDSIQQNAQLLQKLSLESPKSILNHAFSKNFTMSATSTFAMEQQVASVDHALQLYRKIGYGRCGHVFELVRNVDVAKVAVDEDGIELFMELYRHQRIRESFRGVPQHIPLCHIPTPRELVGETDTEWWEIHGPRFPEEHRKPRTVLISERIMPLPKIVRHALVDMYCPKDRKKAAVADPVNRDCLVRVYLGELRNNRPYMNFNLRNFPLYLDQILNLELSTDEVASAMANTLAVIHFKAEHDARDVEFVLGMAPSSNHNQAPSSAELLTMDPKKSTAPPGAGINFKKRWVHLWILDFNECTPITVDEEGMETAAKAFYENAPYYPRPPKAGIKSNAETDVVWDTFQQSYLKTSSIVLRERAMDPEKLPKIFIEKAKEFRPR